MLLCRNHLIGVLTLIHLTHTFVLLTANIADVKNIARKFVSEPLAQQIADFIAKASSNTARDVSEENEQNAEDIKQQSESEQETFNKAARQGKQNYATRKITPSTRAQEDTVSIERTTQVIKRKPRKKVEAKQWQWHGMKVIPLGKENKKNWNQEHSNILRELRPNRMEKKRQYWQQQNNKEIGREESQKGEKHWSDRHSRDQDWQERLKETTERHIFKPKMQEKEAEPQEEKLKGKRHKWSIVKTKSENNWPQTEPKTGFYENEHEVINPAEYDFQTTELDLTNKEQTVSDYEATPDAFERVKERRIRQRKAKNDREGFAFRNVEPTKETEDSTPRINGFNIENELTTIKERNEFNYNDNLKYKHQYYPRSQLVATSGNVMLAKPQDTKPAQMPKEPLVLPKVEPQGWLDNDKEKGEEKVQ